jgi:hypothetical protein
MPSAANETVPEQNHMRAPDYWKSHYVTSTDPAEIDFALRHARLTTDGESLELIYFLNALDAPNVLISQGSGGHSYVFAELAYRVHRGLQRVCHAQAWRRDSEPAHEPPSGSSAIHPARIQ